MKLLHLLRRHDIDPMINDQARFFCLLLVWLFSSSFSPLPPRSLKGKKKKAFFKLFLRVIIWEKC